MNARTFLDEFVKKTASACKLMPDVAGPRTNLMYKVLYSIGENAGYLVRCLPLDLEGQSVGMEEFMNLDFVYFDESRLFSPSGKGKKLRPCPEVVIEHENSYDIRALCRDFRKVCLFAVSLRVFIGYAQSTKNAKSSGEKLIECYDRMGLKQLPDGQTLLIMGFPGNCKWNIWLKEGANRWISVRDNVAELH